MRNGVLALLAIAGCHHDPHATTIDVDAPAATPDAAPAATSPCGAFHGDAAWVCQADGTTLKRTTTAGVETTACATGCIGLPYGFDDQCLVRAGAIANVVNSHAMSATEAAWIHYIAYCVLPPTGDRATRLAEAAPVAWWSLKEGVLDVKNAVAYNNCHKNGTDQIIPPTEVCPSGAAWQVGVSAVQVPNVTLAALEAAAPTLVPNRTEDELLAATAIEAGYAAGTAEHDAIVASTGDLRRAWLLHASVLGFHFQSPIVTSECVTQAKSWCYGTGWTASASFAPTKPAALQAIADVQAILDALAP